MFFDSHCHLTSEQLVPQFDAVLKRAQAADVTHFLNVADDLASAKMALMQIETAASYGLKMWATAGVHPQNAISYTDEVESELRALLKTARFAAVGEIGLDYFYDDHHAQFPGATRAVQQSVFRAQLEIALEFELPVVIHNREADEDLLQIVGEYPKLRGVFHCFCSSVEVANRVLEMGFHLGFGGVVTFKNAQTVRDVATICPLDRTLIETDAPYLAPAPLRGKTNEPSFVPLVAQKIAELRGVAVTEIGATTAKNARQIFGLK